VGTGAALFAPRPGLHSGAAGTSATADAIRGGMQDIWTFGVNWYINTNVKLIWGQDAV
jgi:hypothetical protein